MILFTESFGALNGSTDSDGYILGRWTTWTPYLGGPTGPGAYLSSAGANGQVAFIKTRGLVGVFQGGLGITIPVSIGQTSIVIGAYIREPEPEFAVGGIVNIVATIPLYLHPELDLNDPSQVVLHAIGKYSLQCSTSYGLFVNLSGGDLADSGNGVFGWGTIMSQSAPLLAGLIQQDKWHFVEMKLDWGGSGVAGAMRLDGIDTLPLTTATDGLGNPLSLLSPSQLDISFNGTDFGGVYIADNLPSTSDSVLSTDFIGEITQLSLSPTADGTHLDWTPNTGANHFSRIIPPPDGDASYVYTETPGAIDAYQFALPASGAKAIYQVAVNNDTRQIGAGVRQVAGVAISGGTVATGAAGVSLTTLYQPNNASFYVDPATGAPWTESALAAAEFGVALVS